MCVYYPKSNQYYLGRKFEMHFFLELCPLFDLDFFDIFNISVISGDIDLKLMSISLLSKEQSVL